jgi:hypothetical protein
MQSMRALVNQARWPMVFRLRPCDESLLGRSTHRFDLHWDYDADPDVVHRTFFGFMGDEPWSPGFQRVVWRTPPGELDGAVMDELYSFMAMRVRVIDHVPGCRSVAYVERWSLPLATRMLQVIETTPLANGRTRLRYRIAYDVPLAFWPLHPPVAYAFRTWFRASFRGLERYLQRKSARSSSAPALELA